MARGPSENLRTSDLMQQSPDGSQRSLDARRVVDTAMHAGLETLASNIHLTQLKKEYFETHPEVAQGFDRTILRFHSKDVPQNVSQKYELAFGGLRDSLTATASVLVAKALEKYVDNPPVNEAAMDQEVAQINQWLATELMKVATTRTDRIGSTKIDPTIDLADLEYFGNGLSPAVNLLQVFEKNPRNKPLVEAELRKYLRMRLVTATERAGTYGAANDEGKERFFADFQREIGSMVTLFAGQTDPVIDKATFDKIFTEVQAERQSADSNDLRRVISEVREAADRLYEETGEDKDGKPTTQAQQDIKTLQAGVDRYLTNHDTSGTMLGKNGSLYNIAYYYIFSNALALGAAGEWIMHGTFPAQTLGALGVATALAMPDKIDKLLAPTPEEDRLLHPDVANDQAERSKAHVKTWALAFDKRLFKSSTPYLRDYLKQQPGQTFTSSSDLTQFLARMSDSKREDDDEHKQLDFTAVRDPSKVLAEHDLTNVQLTGPELRQLFSLLSNAVQTNRTPQSVLDT